MKKFQDRAAVVTGAGGGLGLAMSLERARGKEGRKQVIEAMVKKARDPAEVAAAVVDAVAREKFELVVCRDAQAMRLMSRLSPSGLRWAFAWAERNNRMGG